MVTEQRHGLCYESQRGPLLSCWCIACQYCKSSESKSVKVLEATSSEHEGFHVVLACSCLLCLGPPKMSPLHTVEMSSVFHSKAVE